MSPLEYAFYLPPALNVARALLGQRLNRQVDGRMLSGLIVETEAYIGESDLACHARAGRTARTEVMYGPPGRAYVYFIYGMHWMLNVVTGEAGSPAAVLVRALWPDAAVKPAGIIDGPARLCKAFAITGALNGVDLTDASGELFISAGLSVPEESVLALPRVGIQNVPEPWRSKPWRLRVDFNRWQPVS